MWLNNAKASLGDYSYVLFPLINLATIVVISCRISSLYKVHSWHKVPSPWSTVITFGDNYSDSGNGAHITGGKYPSSPWYWHHRFSNGPNWIDNLVVDLGGLGKIKMRNFAHGGASTDNALWQGSLLGHAIPGVHQQVRGFMLKSRTTGYASADKTLYMLWTGANDCIRMAEDSAGRAEGRRFSVDDVNESIFQTILQLERESHNRATQIVVLTPPPVEDSPLVRHGKPAIRDEVRRAAEKMTRDLPHALFQKLNKIGPAAITDSSRLGPLNPPSELPKHRRRAASPITHYITVDLPHDYTHMDAHEHNGTHPVPRPAIIPADGPHHPPVGIHKRSPPQAAAGGSGHGKPRALRPGRLQIMVYDAYNFVKHASTNPHCFGLNPATVNESCGEQSACYDRIWVDDSNINTAVQYWMARDINMRLHMWHLHNTGADVNTVFKNSTRAREVELEMLGYSCPMHAAPTKF
ncbi:hypothetical protein GGI15_001793 [Coemansia interrupta]|uniref:Carbohydrate esterase family 16 protein n=1 Tax=Coemansia interrupta TaxID=1126814 RepID=A0A9W8HK44_9FUNG|nr:hypothetical protein GGI15_001793 [Coemansia interrupta]